MSSPIVQDLLKGVVLPGAIAMIALLIAWQPWRRTRPVEHAYWGGALAFALAYVVGHVLLHGHLPELPPRLVVDWVPLFAIVAAIIGPPLGAWKAPLWVGLIATLLLGTTQSLVIIDDLASPPWETRWIGPLIGVAIGLGVMVAWWSLNTLAQRGRAPSLPICLWIALAGSSALFIEYRFASGAQALGALAAACGSAAIVAWWGKRVTLAHGAVLVSVVLFAGLWLVAVLFGENAKPWAALLAFASPHGAWVGELPVIRSLKPWQRALLSIVAVGTLIGVAVAFGRPPPDPMRDLYESL